MMTVVYVVVGVLMALGLAGALLPFLPGTPLILLGALIYAVATDFSPIGWGRLSILAGLAVAGFALGSLGGAVGTRGSGGSGWAVAGALAGVVVGLAFGPLGLVVGPVAGAIAGELLRSGDVRHSVRSGIGTAIGVVAGAVAHLAVAVAMVGLFAWWVLT
jgi:uncharacterized protein YqgC (DUF456 family)